MSTYLNYVRSQARPRRGPTWTAKNLLIILAFIAMAASAAWWWSIQSTLTPNRVAAIAYTVLLVLAPPCLTSFLIPWSPAGMLLQRINARTWGFVVVFASALYLLYYSFQIQWSWWAAQPVVANSGLVYQQVVIGLIGFILIPALLWTPVTPEELVEQVRQAHLVKRYELQTQADIAILRATLLRAQEQALIGFANLTVEERHELAGVLRGLVAGIDGTLREIGQSVKTVSGATIPFDTLEDNDDIREVLEYIGESLISSTLLDDDEARQALASAADTARLARQPQRPQRVVFTHADGNTYAADLVEALDNGDVVIRSKSGRESRIRARQIVEVR